MPDVAPQLDLHTGAWKRPFFELQLSRAVSKAHRLRTPLTLLYVDLDNLQEHNDLQGQQEVDQWLSEVASKISEVIDGRGPIGRMAGGAFAVFLEGFSLDQALVLAEEIRHRLPRMFATAKLRLTASVGVASLRNGEPSGNLLEAAEQACRKAKQGGRDSVVPR